jgi:hypothetical protein
MEQRPLRLGDLVDDYCPRERRVTNHAVVAMIAEDIKQTRCTACDAEHAYKGGKAPRRRKTESTGRLYKEVLAGITESETIETPSQLVAAPVVEAAPPVPAIAAVEPLAAEPEADAPPADDFDEPADTERGLADEGPVHRPLIRATLPRPEGMKVERPIPDFTIRHNGHNGRGQGGGNFREARAGAKGRSNGQQRFGRGPQSGGGNRPGRGGGHGFGGGRPGGGGGSRRRGR